MHAALKTGPVAIYTRFSSDLQNERSIEDQVRRCREFIRSNGGDPEKAQVFPDFAISGSSLDRRGLEAMMTAVEAGGIRAIVTEDMSRISRDIADAATIFKKLSFYRVPLIGLPDGIDTSQKGAKLQFTVKSLLSDMYLDDLRDKTLRGLEGRALAGYATGNVPFGFHTVHRHARFDDRQQDRDPRGRVAHRGPDLHRVRGRSLARVDRTRPQQRRHRLAARWPTPQGLRLGWLDDSRDAPQRALHRVWKFGERQWIKVPGTNRRQPRARDAAEVMVMNRPETRIINQKVWNAAQQRVMATFERYTRKADDVKKHTGVPRAKVSYLLSGVPFCAECGSPLTLSAGSNASYYRQDQSQTGHVHEPDLAPRGIREAAHPRSVRELARQPGRRASHPQEHRVGAGDHARKMQAQPDERRQRLLRTEEKIRGLIDLIASGDRSDYVVSTMRDLEAYARTDTLIEESRELVELPSIDDLIALSQDAKKLMSTDVDRGDAAPIPSRSGHPVRNRTRRSVRDLRARHSHPAFGHAGPKPSNPWKR